MKYRQTNKQKQQLNVSFKCIGSLSISLTIYYWRTQANWSEEFPKVWILLVVYSCYSLLCSSFLCISCKLEGEYRNWIQVWSLWVVWGKTIKEPRNTLFSSRFVMFAIVGAYCICILICWNGDALILLFLFHLFVWLTL